MAIPALVVIPVDHSGEVLASIAATNAENLRQFNRAAAQVDQHVRARLIELIDREERDGWLSGETLRGRLRP